MMVDPYSFGTNSVLKGDGPRILLVVFASTFFLPLIVVLLMKALGFIPSLELKKAEDRIAPFIATGFFYLSIFYVMYRDPEIPVNFKACFLGAVIGLFIAFFLNLFSKISLHAIGVGGLLGLVIITIASSQLSSFVFYSETFGSLEISFFSLLVATILICGLVGSARLFLDAHVPKDLYGGFLVGLSTQFIALAILT